MFKAGVMNPSKQSDNADKTNKTRFDKLRVVNEWRMIENVGVRLRLTPTYAVRGHDEATIEQFRQQLINNHPNIKRLL
jgi:hypothetical protein